MAFTAALPCLAEESAADSPDKAEGYKILTGGAEFPSYKASDVYDTSTNTDSVWRWQYRNPETKIPYTDLDKAGWNNRDMDVNGRNYRRKPKRRRRLGIGRHSGKNLYSAELGKHNHNRLRPYRCRKRKGLGCDNIGESPRRKDFDKQDRCRRHRA